MKIGKYDYNRCTKKMPCPVCNRTKYCLVSSCGNYILCTKIKEGSQREYKKYSGFLHTRGNYISVNNIVKTKEYKPNIRYIRKVYNSLPSQSRILKPLAESLVVSEKSLYELGVRVRYGKWAFPMYNEKLEIIGLKWRNLQSRKWCEKHSRLGAYVSKRFMCFAPVVVCEGESDTAALLSLGFNAVGRASATSCEAILKKLLRHSCRILVIADNDENQIGLKSSMELVEALGKNKADVFAVTGYKDIREWINSGMFKSKFFTNILEKK